MKDAQSTFHGQRLCYLMKINMPQHPLERLDDLIIGGMKLWQRTDQFCFSIDAVILSHFVPIKSRHVYADLGTSTGVIPLILTGRGAKQVVGFELNPITAELAERNRQLNHKEEEIQIVKADYCHLPMQEYNGRFDTIVVNPPYFDVKQGKAPLTEARQLALHESHTTIEDVAKAVNRLVKFGGSLCMIYRAERLVEALLALQKEGLTPKRLRFVHSLPQREAKLVLIEARKGGRLGLLTEPPLYIYESTNTYSEEVRTWYGTT